ncbi:MAG: NifB/NifX family molybdenum-iron cluster-binding protein [Candidatus Marinimicrobia bacterium]|nr:NifB/NifX family molybdenum-iron cluster-binding protein [Candidatus Neomarinimicrobiota bacterium]
MENGRIAVPSNGTGGLNSTRSGHFGHCDVFTLVDIENGYIKNESTVSNQEHAHGGCMVPVNLLAGQNVNAIVVGGIGKRPLEGFAQVGIDVYFDSVNPHVKTVVEQLIANKLEKISPDQACGGGGGDCH